MPHSFDDPPLTWARYAAHPIGGDVYHFVDPETTGPASHWFWHWCPETDRWRAAGVADHTLVSVDPLHLEPSLLWPCCGKHGFVFAGRWRDA
jgi:hypothetical protein